MKLSALAPLLLTLAASAQDTPVFQATSDLVLVDVGVVHNRTRAATSQLRAEDFALSEDGTPQKISFFSRDQLPLSVILLFDLTDSDRPILRQLAAASRTALEGLKPEDEVAVMDYAASARMVDGFTTNRERTADAIARVARGEKTEEAAFFNEAVYQAAMQLEHSANPSSRRVIIWFTDNLSNAPSPHNLKHHARTLGDGLPHSEEEAVRALHESGTVVMALVKKDPLMLPFYELMRASEAGARKQNPAGDVHKYAELTGGMVLGIGKSVRERLAEIISDIRGRYTLGFRPAQEKPAATFCRLRVTLAPTAPLRAREWTVLARTGYYRK